MSPSKPTAAPLAMIDIAPWGDEIKAQRTTALFKSSQMEVIRMALPSGKEIPEHKAPGEITVQCLEGRIEFCAAGQVSVLRGGQMLYVLAGVPHSLRALDDSSMLLTIVRTGAMQ